VRGPFVTRAADRVLSPLIGKSLVLYLTKPEVAVAGVPEEGDAATTPRPAVPRGVPGRKGAAA
jgi:hypothetical protein